MPILKSSNKAYADFIENYWNFLKGNNKNKKKKEPKLHFKKRSDTMSLSHEQPRDFKIKTFNKKARVFGFPKMEDGLKIIYHKNIIGKPGTQKIIKEGNRWYLCVTVTENTVEYPFKNKVVGIDLGVNRTVQMSHSEDSYKNLPIDLLKKLEERKAVLQRRLKRKQGGDRSKKITQSKNYKKAYERIAKIDKRIAAIRKSFLAQFSTEIVRENDTIFVENLKVKNMTKSAKGTKESPGKNVAQKKGLNRSILRAAPYMFKTMLKNKSKEYGRQFVEIDPKYTSQMCSECGHTEKTNRETQEKFECVECGFSVNADYNASLNIRNIGCGFKNNKEFDEHLLNTKKV